MIFMLRSPLALELLGSATEGLGFGVNISRNSIGHKAQLVDLKRDAIFKHVFDASSLVESTAVLATG